MKLRARQFKKKLSIYDHFPGAVKKNIRSNEIVPSYTKSFNHPKQWDNFTHILLSALDGFKHFQICNTKLKYYKKTFE